MVAAVMAHDGIPNTNVYTGLHLMNAGLARGKRGPAVDIVAVLGLVADQDADTGKVGELPLEPTYAVETSPGNLQPAWLFDRPLTASEAKPIAAALRAATGADSGTADIAHIWRIPGTLNWPNAAKLARGRSSEPAAVALVGEVGTLTNPDAMAGVLAAVPCKVAALTTPTQIGELPEVADITVSEKSRALLEADGQPDRSAHAASVVEQLAFEGHSVEQATALIMACDGAWTERYPDVEALLRDVARLWGKYGEPHELARGEAAEMVAPLLLGAANDNEPDVEKPSRFQFTWFDNIEEGKLKQTFIKGVFGLREFTTVSGLPGSG